MSQVECCVNEGCKKYTNGECLLTVNPYSISCPRLYKIEYLMKESMIPKNKWTYQWLNDTDDIEAFSTLKAIESHIIDFISGGYNLYLFSHNVGNGKTSWAYRLVRQYFLKIWSTSDYRCRALFINVPEFLLKLKDNISEKNDYISHIKENVFDVDIVVWDDIATKGATEYERENLLSIINSRISNGKSNIYTSNISPDMLAHYVDDRLASRIVGMSEIVEMRARDKRGGM